MQLSHLDKEGNAIMVDVSEKKDSFRTAVAKGIIYVNGEVLQQIKENTNKKGNVLGVAEVAGIMAVKNTSHLIPLTHPIQISNSEIHFNIDSEKKIIEVECRVKCFGKTGVEMEALTGVSVALLTIYDMCKAVDKNMMISNVYLKRKEGGKSGLFLSER